MKRADRDAAASSRAREEVMFAVDVFLSRGVANQEQWTTVRAAPRSGVLEDRISQRMSSWWRPRDITTVDAGAADRMAPPTKPEAPVKARVSDKAISQSVRVCHDG